MSNLALQIEKVGKRYRIGSRQARPDTLVGAATQLIRAPLQSFRSLRSLSSFEDENADDVLWALRDVSFDVKHGEAVGLIGRNGAGKSTLLKILSRITDPSTGSIGVYGRIASLLEVGTGFNDELTGRENTYLNGAILGMTRAEVDRKFDEIVAFSEIEAFIDTPVKRYSSGMKVRLAFAVAAHLEPEILLVDEVLAVGDVAFQRKCLGKMDDVSSEGRTVVFVSHHMSMIQALCKRGIVLDGGQVTFDGDVDDSVGEYLKQMESAAEDPFGDNPDREGNGAARVTGLTILGPDGEISTSVVSGEAVTIVVEFACNPDVAKLDGSLTIYDDHGIALANFDTQLTDFAITSPGRSGAMLCTIPTLPMVPGRYRVGVSLRVGRDPADVIPSALLFDVASTTFFANGRHPKRSFGQTLVHHEWAASPPHPDQSGNI